MHHNKDTQSKIIDIAASVWIFRVFFSCVLTLFSKVPVIMIKPQLPQHSHCFNQSVDSHLPDSGKLYSQRRLEMKLLAFLWLFAVPSLSFSQPVSFTEVSTAAGINYTGHSFGASWGDADGDGFADLWLSNHGNDPHLYINNGLGGFEENSSRIDFTTNTDMHGAAWADYDNDGDQDLLLMVGAESGNGVGPNQFFVNDNNVSFKDEANSSGLDYPEGRGRTPMWLDWDSDGLLDVVLNNWGRTDGLASTALFAQSDNALLVSSFTDTFDITGISDDDENSYSQIVMIGSEAKPHILITGSPYPAKIYDYQPPEQDATDIRLTSGLPEKTFNVKDTVIADFNGDLLSDMLLLRNSGASNIVELNDTQARARMVMDKGEIGISVITGGTLTVALNPPWQLTATPILVGANSMELADTTFTLDPANIDMHGAPTHEAGIDSGVYIGYSPGTQEWTILISRDSWMGINVELTSTEQITVAPIGFEPSDGALPYEMYAQIEGAPVEGPFFNNKTTDSGLADEQPWPCAVGTAADFDNDMDVDIYLVCSGPVTNRDNRLLVNDGSGHFTLAEGAWGATANVSGLGDVVASADYDNDGFVDLVVTNGSGATPFNIGPTLLFKNQGNANHWLAVDLEGVTSNRDAIGARVILTATAGGKSQLREQLGGMHQYTQDYSRLQFGLGENTQVDKMVVHWPGGTIQTLLNVPVDQIISVKEAEGTFDLSLQQTDPVPDNDDSNTASTPNGGGGSAVSIYTLALLLLLSGYRIIQRKR